MRRLYVLVRTDIKTSSPAVQAGHAVAQFMLENPDCEWNNSYLIYLKVANSNKLDMYKKQVEFLISSDFREPDLDNEVTATAIYGRDTKLFSELRLL